jgi:hypothetical protein
MKNDMEKKLNTRIDMVPEQFVHPKLKTQIMNDLKIIYSNEQKGTEPVSTGTYT